VVAGITMMERRRFFTWSAVGAVLWITSITLLGFFLGQTIPALKENIDYAVLAILAFSVIPIAIEWWRHRRTHAPEAADLDGDGIPDRDITGMDTTKS
jgi:membrane-associated protein